jgi:hypothetical protein
MPKHLQVNDNPIDGNIVEFGTNGFATNSGYRVSDILNNSASSLDWSQNITTDSSTPVYGTFGFGYTAESSATSKLIIPTTADENDRIGAATDDSSMLLIELDDTTPYFTLIESQSVVLRYDTSKAQWLVENSHLPTMDTSSTTIYVDGFAANGGDGSILLPFNSLITARDTVIGSGTAQNPELAGIVIKVTAGNFIYSGSDNFWIEGVTYDFDEGVVMDINSGSGYSFDNSISTSNPSQFFITGSLSWQTNQQNCGFIYAEGRDQGGSGSTNWARITATFNSGRNFFNTGNDKAVPIITTSCPTVSTSFNNAFTTSWRFYI